MATRVARGWRALATAAGALLAAAAVAALLAVPALHRGARAGNAAADIMAVEMGGEGRHVVSFATDECLQRSGDDRGAFVESKPCDKSNKRQKWIFLSSKHRLATPKSQGGFCMDAGGQFVHTWDCLEGADAQHWEYEATKRQIRNSVGYCLEANTAQGKVGMLPCSNRDEIQMWSFGLGPAEAKVPRTTAAPTTTEAPTTSERIQKIQETTQKIMTTLKPETPPTLKPETPPKLETTPKPKKQHVSAARKPRVPAGFPSEAYQQLTLDHKFCLDAGGQKAHMWPCDPTNNNQQWLFDSSTKHWRSKGVKSKGVKCLDSDSPSFSEVCDNDSQAQKWAADSTGQIRSELKQRCLFAKLPNSNGTAVELKVCDPKLQDEIWKNMDVQAKESESSGTMDAIIVLTIPVFILALVFIALYVSCARKPTTAVQKKTSGPPTSVQKPLPPQITDPKPSAIRFCDPRPNSNQSHDVDVVAFGFPGREEPWDELSSASWLSNSFDIGADGMSLEAHGVKKSFRNAEAAFQALKFWPVAQEFCALSGEEAKQKSQQLNGTEDFDFSGYGCKWDGMMAVLSTKFKSGSKLDRALEKTGDAFLLYHTSEKGDQPWSDNSDGLGSNWLGMQLMLLRDKRTGWRRWTSFIESSVDKATGNSLSGSDANSWQDAVRSARNAVEAELLRQQDDERESNHPLLDKGRDDTVGGTAGKA